MSKHARRKSPQSERPRSRLGLPDLGHSKATRPDSLRSPESKRGHRHAIDEFIQWYCSERLSFNKIVVARHRILVENCDLATGRIKLATSRRCIGWPMRLRTVACSAPNSSQVPDV